MHSILMMAVLSSASTAPGQFVYYGPCGSVYATPWVAYYPVAQVAGEERSAPGRQTVQHKLEDLAALIARISRRLEKAEDRFQAMEEKQRDLAQALERKLEHQAKQQEKALEARIKEERMRGELQALKEKTRFLEYIAKILAMTKQQQEEKRLEKVQQQMEKLQAQLKKVEKAMQAIAAGNRSPEAALILSEASEQEDVPEDRALIIVTLPENAKLFLNNKLRKGTAKQRFIVTPQLEDGDYIYTLRVDAERDGQVQSQTRQVTFRRGAHVRVKFDP